MFKYVVISGPYFPAFELNTERYEVSLRIQSESGKIQSRNNSVFGHFLRSDFVISTPVIYTRPGTPRGIYHKFLIIGFQRAKILKDILLRAIISQVQKNEGFCGPCKKSRCEICEHIVSTNSFKSTTTQ